MKLFIAWLLFIAIGATVSAGEPPRSASLASVNISSKLDYYADTSNALTALQVFNIAPQQWRAVNASEVNFGLQAASYWFRYSLAENSAQPYWIEIDSPTLSTANLYSLDSQTHELNKQSSGRDSGIDSKAYYSNFNYLPLYKTSQEPQQFLLQVNASTPIKFRVWLYDAQQFQHHALNKERIYGVYFGLIVALLIYNLFLFVSIRDVQYLYYVACTLAGAAVVASIQGYFHLYFVDVNDWLDPRLGYFCVSAYLFFFTLFAIMFLHVSQFSMPAYRLCQGMCWLSAGLFCSAFFQWGIATTMLHYYVMLFDVLLVAVVTIMAIKHQAPGAKLFLLANATTLLSGLLSFLTIYGFPGSFITNYPVELGTAAQGLFLSIALAEKIKWVRQENLLLQQENLRTLQAVSKTKDDFLSTVSHELRTPMNGVVGCLELMKAQAHQAYDQVDTAIAAAGQMTVMIENILTFSELQANRSVSRKEVQDHYQVVQRMQDVYVAKCAAKGLQFKVVNSKSLPRFITTDAGKGRSIASRLIDNAIKFTQSGGIEVIYSPSPKLDEEGVLWVQVAVCDTGVGIAADKQAELFLPFHQVQNSYDGMVGGLGIGLSIVKALCEVQGGRLTVQSELGKGSCFTATIPYYPIAEHQIEDYRHEKKFIQRSESRIALVVEDNEVNQMVLCRSLNHLGFTTLTADNGEQALTVLAEKPVSVVFMDCQMPVMDGFEATLQIRQQSCYDDLPIIAVTANASERDRDRCLSVGMNDFIKKPVRKSTLEIKLQHWGFAPVSQ